MLDIEIRDNSVKKEEKDRTGVMYVTTARSDEYFNFNFSCPG